MPVAAHVSCVSRTISTSSSIGTSTRGVRTSCGYQVATVRGVMPLAAAMETSAGLRALTDRTPTSAITEAP